MLSKLILKWILVIINLLAAFALAVTNAGSVLSPEVIVVPAYFALFLPLTLLVNIGFVLFWMVVRKWTFLLSLSMLIISAQMIGDTFPFHFGRDNRSNEEESGISFKILTYNTHMSGLLKKNKPDKPNKVFQYIAHSGADVICMQEFTASDNEEFLTEKDVIAILKDYPYRHIEYSYDKSNKSFGVATFSKFPILDRRRIKYYSVGNLSICTYLKIGNDTVLVVNNHLESNRLTENDKSMPIKLKSNFDTENFSDLTLQFSNKLGQAYKLRACQADSVAKFVKKNSNRPLIVCGDFNDVPGSYAYTTVKGGLTDVYSYLGSGFGWTFNEKFYHFRIDYFLCDTQKVLPLKYKMDKVRHSDHYPIIAQFQTKHN